MTREELKQRYDTKKIGEIEKEIEKNRGTSFKAQQEMTFALAYLKMSGRFKENPQYKKSSFETYLLGQVNMRLGTFRENERAIMHYPEVAKKYGIGLVAKIHRKCGAPKEAEVFKEIYHAQGDSKSINQAKIESIVVKHTPPQKAKIQPVDWKTLYHKELEAHRETTKLLSAARAQIEKLKKTVVEFRLLRALKAAIEPFMAVG